METLLEKAYYVFYSCYRINCIHTGRLLHDFFSYLFFKLHEFLSSEYNPSFASLLCQFWAFVRIEATLFLGEWQGETTVATCHNLTKCALCKSDKVMKIQGCWRIINIVHFETESLLLFKSVVESYLFMEENRGKWSLLYTTQFPAFTTSKVKEELYYLFLQRAVW